MEYDRRKSEPTLTPYRVYALDSVGSAIVKIPFKTGHFIIGVSKGCQSMLKPSNSNEK